jgi:hypothetical protein
VRQAQPDGFVLPGPFSLVDRGAALVSVVEGGSGGSNLSGYEVFSTRTGQVLRVLRPISQAQYDLLWANPTGTVVVGNFPTPKGSTGPLEWITATRHIGIRGLPAGVGVNDMIAF